MEVCIYCGKPISAYPCKFCGYKLSVSEDCPRFKMGHCLTTRKLCPNKKDYMNCEVFDMD